MLFETTERIKLVNQNIQYFIRDEKYLYAFYYEYVGWILTKSVTLKYIIHVYLLYLTSEVLQGTEQISAWVFH